MCFVRHKITSHFNSQLYLIFYICQLLKKKYFKILYIEVKYLIVGIFTSFNNRVLMFIHPLLL